MQIKTNSKEELVDITPKIKEFIKGKTGAVLIYIPHTTAGITINENADPDVKDDILKALKIFDNNNYKHSEGNSPAHVKASLMGFSTIIPIKDGELQLGTWQGILFAEFDGPRTRNVIMKILA